jgi:hypothetical protein
MGRISKCEKSEKSCSRKKLIIPTNEVNRKLKYDSIDEKRKPKYEDENYEDDVFYPQESKNRRRGGGNSFERAIKSLSSKSHKIKKSRGNCDNSDKISGALRTALSFMPGVKHKLADNLHQILEAVHDHIPLAVNIVLPMALRNVLPGGLHRPASAAVAEHVVPVIQNILYPGLVSRVIPEEVRYEMAIRKSLRKSSRFDSEDED